MGVIMAVGVTAGGHPCSGRSSGTLPRPGIVLTPVPTTPLPSILTPAPPNHSSCSLTALYILFLWDVQWTRVPLG